MAAEQAMAQGNDQAAESALSRIASSSLDVLQYARVQLVRAEIGMHRGQPQTVLRSLPANSTHVPSLAPRMELLRGRAYFTLGDPVAGVRTLVAREASLTSPQSVSDNREQIWRGLSAAPLPATAEAIAAKQDPVTRGWIDLAAVTSQGANAAAIAAWTQRNPGHPASTRVASLPLAESPAIPAVAASGVPDAAAPPVAGTVPPPSAVPGETVMPVPPLLAPVSGGWALMLPLTGNLAASGRAVREGFISAWFESPEPRPALRIYDAGSTAAVAVTAFEAAARDGAGLVIGPLTKDGVGAIARLDRHLPWLGLNYVDGAPATSAAFALQFGLAPEDEARAAAVDAAGMGRLHALAMVPNNDWGARVFQSFATAFEAQGGTVLQSVRVAPGIQDFGKPLQELLKLDRSQARHQQLTAALGVPSEFEPRPRQDADVLFAPLRVNEARALVPQLDFFHAQRLITYTVSSAYAGEPDAQLDGLRLCDMPWVMESGSPGTSGRERATLEFPDVVGSQPRLFALGRDAFALAQGMSRGALNAASVLEGASGRLSLTSDSRVSRQTSCQLIRNGRPAGTS
ncbi:MAG: penicillin-binding protein activator [Panacagrimonas sp.]